MVASPAVFKPPRRAAFTLIELSIVLVIVGLIIGGVLVGRDLIDAAAIRSQISQIEKYQTAVNTFRGKYGYLPGDIPDPVATQYGFFPRGSAGQGDGNGIIQGGTPYFVGSNMGYGGFGGETEAFWTDLSTANLIDGSFSQNNVLFPPGSVSATQVGLYMPAAKVGTGNYVYVWSGGWSAFWANNNKNYFGLAAVRGSPGSGWMASDGLLSVQQAYNIDKKIDDGLPQSGRVSAMMPAYYGGYIWVAGGANDPTLGSLAGGDSDLSTGGPVTLVSDIGRTTAAGVNSCYDGGINPNTYLPERYSTEINNGANFNCALSFQFQ